MNKEQQVTIKACKKFWVNQISLYGLEYYRDNVGEIDFTEMGEEYLAHADIEPDSDLEETVFDATIDYINSRKDYNNEL